MKKKVLILTAVFVLLFSTSVSAYQYIQWKDFGEEYSLGESYDITVEGTRYRTDLYNQLIISTSTSDRNFNFYFTAYDDDTAITKSTSFVYGSSFTSDYIPYTASTSVDRDVYLHTTLSKYCRYNHTISGRWYNLVNP